jgi:hypothetical protein
MFQLALRTPVLSHIRSINVKATTRVTSKEIVDGMPRYPMASAAGALRGLDYFGTVTYSYYGFAFLSL